MEIDRIEHFEHSTLSFLSVSFLRIQLHCVTGCPLCSIMHRGISDIISNTRGS